MNKITFITVIIVFFLKTGNVFSNNNIFYVDNIIIKNDKNYSKNELVNKAFKKGFKKLINKILLEKDVEKIEQTNLPNIKKLISSYQVQESKELLNLNDVVINLTFDREKINQFFYSKNILYADISKTDVVVLPVLIDSNQFYLFSDNYFYSNWNSIKKQTNDQFINYILPVESLESIEFINKNKNDLESLDIKNILSGYDIKDYIFLVINPGSNNIEVFFKGFFSNNEIVKNFSINNTSQEQSILFDNTIEVIKYEINEAWKSQNLIDVGAPSFLNIKLDINKKNDLLNLQLALNKIDLIENYYVLELNKNYAKIKIKYLGKIDKMKSKFNDQGIKVTISNEEWKLELI